MDSRWSSNIPDVSSVFKPRKAIKILVISLVFKCVMSDLVDYLFYKVMRIVTNIKWLQTSVQPIKYQKLEWIFVALLYSGYFFLAFFVLWIPSRTQICSSDLTNKERFTVLVEAQIFTDLILSVLF